MNFEEVINRLDLHARTWASTLTSEDLATILSAVYRVPGLINALKPQNNSINHNNASNGTAYMGAADIGKKGEAEFERICRSLPSTYKLINTAKIGKQGDFIIEYYCNNKQHRCLVDIKNYKTTVPKKEVDKFYEDMTYGSYDGGIMISYATHFTGIDSNVFIENKSLPYAVVPIMFLSDIPYDLIIKCIEILFLKITISVEKQTYFTNIESCLSFINIALQQSSNTRRLLSEMSNNITNQIQKCQENLIGLEVQIKQAIKTININIHKSNQPDVCQTNDYQSIDKHFNIKQSDDNQLDIKHNDLDQQNKTKSSTDTKTIDYHLYCHEDRMFLHSLEDLKWTDVDSSYLAYTTKKHSITCQLKPLKTRTNVQITIPYFYVENTDQEKTYTELIKLLKKKADIYITTLNNDFVSKITELFNYI